MAETKDPLRQLVDLALYAPIGLLSRIERELPQLVTDGRARFDNQITLARFMGKMAVKQGRRIVERRIEEVIAARRAVPDESPEATPAATPEAAPTRSTSLTLVTDSEPSGEPADDEMAVASTPAPRELPIDGYDSLAASQVVLRLGSLTPAELEAIAVYETHHRARRTVLGKIHQLQAS